ncbi:MAG: N-formylglutamate amidohydrolase [Myxococcota bacterium]|nr:N-formylglutamate amidohydrolase [Myxococcota bacterium]
MPVERTEAVEIFGDRHHTRRLVVTCEHASYRVPAPLKTTRSDREWLRTHWGWDIGAAEVTRQLVRRKSCVALLARYSRLVCDANRAPEDETYIRRSVEDVPLSFNQALDDAEIQRRFDTYHKPYHELLDACLAERVARGGDVVLFSIHSFTPVFGGAFRPMEMGVLFDRYEPVARRLAGHLEDVGFKTALNEPYSGARGEMYAMERHGPKHGVVYLELEIRQDLLDTPAKTTNVAERLCAALTELQVRTENRS